ncbi:PUA-like domain-containing protein [Clohesyomyces aquaticus]|uniref:Thymocyte nuclear protein 1 n=1 Tax=Clohesyomyces aquaticus TaxID=1231657 RepID=A0A1Y1YLQ6_9PLEO|nr:PUA-like domain-containing protein [Clohesyomyces aquaticus]
MAGNRKSTRQSASTAPKYAESGSDFSEGETKSRKRSAAKPTRRKRPREANDEGDDVKDEDSPPAKKPAKAKARAAKPPASKPSSASTALAPPPTNRDADGSQSVYWLFKAEPLPRFENGVNVAFSIDDLRACTKPEPWSGVRNPQARNNMQAMRKGDLGFFYHSNAKPSGVVGVLRVVEEAKADETAFDPKDPYYDAKSEREKPKWYCVGVEFVRKFDEMLDLKMLKGFGEKGAPLEGMQLVTSSRLSVSRVSKEEWGFIMGLADADKVDGEEEKDAPSDEKDKTEAARESDGQKRADTTKDASEAKKGRKGKKSKK